MGTILAVETLLMLNAVYRFSGNISYISAENHRVIGELWFKIELNCSSHVCENFCFDRAICSLSFSLHKHFPHNLIKIIFPWMRAIFFCSCDFQTIVRFSWVPLRKVILSETWLTFFRRIKDNRFFLSSIFMLMQLWKVIGHCKPSLLLYV